MWRQQAGTAECPAQREAPAWHCSAGTGQHTLGACPSEQHRQGASRQAGAAAVPHCLGCHCKRLQSEAGMHAPPSRMSTPSLVGRSPGSAVSKPPLIQARGPYLRQQASRQEEGGVGFEDIWQGPTLWACGTRPPRLPPSPAAGPRLSVGAAAAHPARLSCSQAASERRPFWQATMTEASLGMDACRHAKGSRAGQRKAHAQEHRYASCACSTRAAATASCQSSCQCKLHAGQEPLPTCTSLRGATHHPAEKSMSYSASQRSSSAPAPRS